MSALGNSELRKWMRDLYDDETDDADEPVVPPQEMTPAEVEQALADHQLYVESSGRQGKYVDLACAIISDFDFSGRDLHGMHFDHSTFTRCRFVGTVLHGATFSRTKAEGCDMRDADLVKAELHSSDLRTVCLDGANLRRTTLIGCDLRGASLRGADLTGALVSECDLRGAVLDPSGLSEAFASENQL